MKCALTTASPIRIRSRWVPMILLVSILITPPPTVQAQLGGIVHDPINLAKMVEEWAKEAARWERTLEHYTQQIQHYLKIYQNALDQLATMRNVLKTVDQELAKQKALIHLVSDVGQAIRGAYQLKRQFEQLITYERVAIRNIETRFKNGVFDPQADLRDFEDYLKYSVGRSSQETVARLRKLAAQDAQLQAWILRRSQVEEDLAVYYDTLTHTEQRLAEEGAKSPDDLALLSHLNDVIQRTQALIQQGEAEFHDLQNKIAERYAKYGLRLQDQENAAYSVLSVDDAWKTLQAAKDRIEAGLGQIMKGQHP